MKDGRNVGAKRIRKETWGQPLTGDKMDENGMKGMSVQREMMGMIFKRSLKG